MLCRHEHSLMGRSLMAKGDPTARGSEMQGRTMSRKGKRFFRQCGAGGRTDSNRQTCRHGCKRGAQAKQAKATNRNPSFSRLNYLVAALCTCTLSDLPTLGKMNKDLEGQGLGVGARLTRSVDGFTSTDTQGGECRRRSLPCLDEVQLDQELLACADLLDRWCRDDGASL